ncbi:MAG TPA: class I SAM-dependent methyltransferase [Anaerolineales bacterium]|nr:class I SAM-dependent methyltransferase [Anaerolineales bacterium]
MKEHASTALTPYQTQYVDFNFERSGLFDLLEKKYHPIEVLYPGCSVHITPAFSFPHVVFVDQSPQAAAFFADQDAILELVKRRRTYRRSPYIQFLAQDFTRPLPLPEGQFDLLLALFAGGVSKACLAYLKPGGLLLSNNHHNDAVEAAQEPGLTLVATLQNQRGKYRLLDHPPGKPAEIERHASQPPSNLRQTSRGIEYIDDQTYYLFKATRPVK